MKIKWYISALIIVFAVLSMSQEQSVVPNQEVLLQFSNKKIDLSEKQEALLTVKQQLKSVGAKHIQVQELKNGTLKITYLSITNTANVEAALSNIVDVESTKDGETPLNQDKKTYNLDVYEILKANDSTSGVGDKFVFELKQEYVRFYNPNVVLYCVNIVNKETTSLFKVAYKINESVAGAIDNYSYKIPEVRAGPIC
ncbi:hypothetical protein [Lacinutrix sp. 5H-3-7-4]|uniref:hypothetical protein n=1 Tax=Lacinutrix sp. (strain 5H-3-7-4) TaxID=983544 RepID=UPI00020A358B|nr:hypothetical protein [Lacinutrix sp. 5H-3-7-4]AEH00209.1 hypothetical protein Lacal_0357 [Lacinutrix sp. 5H-3-7-4]